MVVLLLSVSTTLRLGQCRPFRFHFRVEHHEVRRGQEGAFGDPSMSLLTLGVGAPSACAGEVELAQGEVEMILYLLVQVALVPFERKEVVASHVGDFLGDVGVSAHRINGDGVAFEVESFEQARDRFHLVALLRDELLSEGDATLRDRRADRVDRIGFQSVTATQALAV